MTPEIAEQLEVIKGALVAIGEEADGDVGEGMAPVQHVVVATLCAHFGVAKVRETLEATCRMVEHVMSRMTPPVDQDERSDQPKKELH